ncbi:hypothetical protein I1A49_01835 [Streptomyces malaysiensis subsp. malaysiensis]|uniref:Uncharacterized protein n=1 Tax=Streptomyces malaysiensis TaxID=92644 RepID=A0ABX6VWP7_STRMQ|nr:MULTISPECIES: hypothetical protein [Streptomyces]QPI53835.1 hypothetical protein I1A49_01835 [Streptomyces solisilvae]UHH15194.1 hypothetical protein LUV23_01855 [Streptomyces sp. HNM0561]
MKSSRGQDGPAGRRDDAGLRATSSSARGRSGDVPGRRDAAGHPGVVVGHLTVGIFRTVDDLSYRLRRGRRESDEGSLCPNASRAPCRRNVFAELSATVFPTFTPPSLHRQVR